MPGLEDLASRREKERAFQVRISPHPVGEGIEEDMNRVCLGNKD